MSSLLPYLLFSLILQSTLVVSLSQSQNSSEQHDQCDALIRFRDSITIAPGVAKVTFNSWKNGTECCLWEGVTCAHYLTGPITGLDLSWSGIQGTLSSNSMLFSLRSLEVLDIGGNSLVGPVPTSLGNLTALVSLNLLGNNFSGTLDFEIFSELKNLQSLLLPRYVNLVVHKLGNCSFPNMTKLTLNWFNLTNFPYFVRSMEKLSYLDLSHNMIDEIPMWFWSIGRHTLYRLDLSDNKIAGTIGRFPRWKKLWYIDLRKNLLQGPLPVLTPSIEHFDVSNNHFTGYISSDICQVSSLTYVLLSDNNLNDTILRCMGNLSGFGALGLGNNQLEGSLPRSLANCTGLSYLNVSHNHIYDTFPDWFQTSFLTTLDLQSNNFHRVLPSLSAFPFPEIDIFIIPDNDFTGQWPAGYLVNTSCRIIQLDNNYFEGPLPIPSKYSATFYSVSNNMFTGEIPSSFCKAIILRIINLSGNNLTGRIPHQCLENLDLLLVLNLRANNFVGEIPELYIPTGNSLRTIDLSENQLRGTLLESMKYCKKLEVLDLSSNRIEGVFPEWLGGLPELKVLVLKSNLFHGHVSNSYKVSHPFPQLHIFDISNNQFSGPLPTEYMSDFTAMLMNGDEGHGHLFEDYNGHVYQDSITIVMKGMDIKLVKILSVFTTIDLSGNSFQGEIPEVIGNLKALKGLNFSHNNLTGTIPSSIGNLTNLEWLDLSSNKLSGEIPISMVDITSLEILNVSENQLRGQIPQGKQFNTFKIDSFEGNPGLCGFPLLQGCREDDPQRSPPSIFHGEEEADDGSWIEWRAVLMGYGCGIVCGVSAMYIILETGRPFWLVKIVEREVTKMVNKLKKKQAPVSRARYISLLGFSLLNGESPSPCWANPSLT